MQKRVETRHPKPGKQSVNIARHKNNTLQHTIWSVLNDQGGTTFTELTNEVRRCIEASLEDAIPWYITTAKLDLEARGLLEPVRNSHPQRPRLLPAGRGELTDRQDPTMESRPYDR